MVDVKAIDEQGIHYQIEIQLELKQALQERMLYTWSSIYHSLLQKGKAFDELKKVVSIWIIGDNLYPDVNDHHLLFSANDPVHKISLCDHLEIHVLQLPKWQWQGVVQEALDLWMLLFTMGENLDVDNPPVVFQFEVMNMVLETLKRFSENKDDYLMYESRRIAQLQANTDKKWKARTLAELEQLKDEVRQKEIEVRQKEAELSRTREERNQYNEELNRLRTLLKKSGIDPDLKELE